MKTAVDLWSNNIAMELPSPHIPSLLELNVWRLQLHGNNIALGRDFNLKRDGRCCPLTMIRKDCIH